MGFVVDEIMKIILRGERLGEPISITSKKVARHVVDAYFDRVTFVLDDAEVKANLTLDFDGDVRAHQRWRRAIHRAHVDVELWHRRELNRIEEGA